jgi:hypothetical protein
VPTILLLEWISAALNVGLIVEIAARRLSWGPQMAHKVRAAVASHALPTG